MWKIFLLDFVRCRVFKTKKTKKKRIVSCVKRNKKNKKKEEKTRKKSTNHRIWKKMYLFCRRFSDDGFMTINIKFGLK